MKTQGEIEARIRELRDINAGLIRSMGSGINDAFTRQAQIDYNRNLDRIKLLEWVLSK